MFNAPFVLYIYNKDDNKFVCTTNIEKTVLKKSLYCLQLGASGCLSLKIVTL